MIKFYVLQVRLGMSIEDVPERYRDKVKEASEIGLSNQIADSIFES